MERTIDDMRPFSCYKEADPQFLIPLKYFMRSLLSFWKVVLHD